jgi:2-amino-4-hydroxy-6-hydroxymethyldihydropteridine diphosphokinase
MILIALGSNIDGPWGTPRSTLRKAISRLESRGCRVIKASSLIRTPPFGNTAQPDFVNAVVRLKTRMSPEALLEHLQQMERMAGRVRREKWGPRTLDLDILDYEGIIRGEPPPVLPHPGIPERSFVLVPIAEIAPRWRHPVLRKTAKELLRQLEHPHPDLAIPAGRA